MAKLIIGKSAPKSFALRVEVPTPTGPADINFEAKHLPSTEWAKMREEHAETIGKRVQELFDNAKVEATRAYTLETQAGPKKSVSDEEREKAIAALTKPVKESEIASLKAKYSGEMIAKITTAWDLDESLNATTLAEMCDQYPGAAEAVFKAYNETREGLRLGN